MEQRLNAGGILDLLTKSELDECMGHNFDAAIRDLYRGLDYLMFTGTGNGTATLTIPYAPESGYTWSLKLIGVTLSGLSAGSVAAYLSETIGQNLIGFATGVSTVPGAAVITWSSNQMVIKDGRVITLAGGSNILNYLMTVLQVPTEMQGKL
jgi:hypothetical protein